MIPVTIQKFQAFDGALFDDAEKCEAYEAEVAAVRDMMAPLGERPDLLDYPVVQYRQHDPAVVRACRGRLVDYLRAGPLKWFFDTERYWQGIKSEDIPATSFVGRVAGDCGGPSCDAFRRFATIDEQGREWGQPYFANNYPSNSVEKKEER